MNAEWEPGLSHGRLPFRSDAGEFAATIAETPCSQGFEAELAGLPGRILHALGVLPVAP